MSDLDAESDHDVSDLHASDSAVQRKAEAVIREALSERLGKPLAPRSLRLAGGAEVRVDGASPNDDTLVEIFARQGALKAGQQKKVAIDAFKLITLGRERPEATLLLCFADEAAAAFATGSGWVAVALRTWAVGVEVVAIPEDLRREIVAAQVGQTMVSPGSEREPPRRPGSDRRVPTVPPSGVELPQARSMAELVAETLAALGGEATRRDLIEAAVRRGPFTDAQRAEPSRVAAGKTRHASELHHRMGWALSHAKNAGLIEPARHGVWRLAPRPGDGTH